AVEIRLERSGIVEPDIAMVLVLDHVTVLAAHHVVDELSRRNGFPRVRRLLAEAAPGAALVAAGEHGQARSVLGVFGRRPKDSPWPRPTHDAKSANPPRRGDGGRGRERAATGIADHGEIVDPELRCEPD